MSFIVDNPISGGGGSLAVGAPITGGTAGSILVETALNELGEVAAVATGQVLVSNGLLVPPVYSSTPTVERITLTDSLALVFSKEQGHDVFVEASTTPGTIGAQLTVLGGDGSPADAINPAGNGGAFLFRAGKGGAASAVFAGGLGAPFLHLGGIGGDGTATMPAGAGGLSSVLGGNAGTAFAGGGANSGGVDLDAGIPSGAGLGGIARLGPFRANSTEIGRAGKFATSMGNFKRAQGNYGHSIAKTFATSGYLALATDDVITWDCTGGACIQLLPDLATVRDLNLTIAKITAPPNSLTITPFAGQTINGAATLVLLPRSTAYLYAGPGTDWYVL